jgi:hypothetical protein
MNIAFASLTVVIIFLIFYINITLLVISNKYNKYDITLIEKYKLLSKETVYNFVAVPIVGGMSFGITYVLYSLSNFIMK